MIRKWQRNLLSGSILVQFIVITAMTLIPETAGAYSFNPNVRADDDMLANEQRAPALALNESGDLYAVWQDVRQGNWDINFTRSSDAGITFDPSVRVENDANAGLTDQVYPDIAARGENVFVVWQDERNENWDIYCTRSTNGGASFGDDILVNDDETGLDQVSPAIAAQSDGQVYVVWVDNRNNENYDIYFSKSTDRGLSFGSNVRVDSDISGAWQQEPSLAVSGENVYAVWRDRRNGNDDIYFARSTDGGNSFGSDVRVDDDTTTAQQSYPRLAIDELGNIYVVWQDYRNGNYDVYFSYSTDGGLTFGDGLLNSNDIRVDDTVADTSYQLEPSIAYEDGRVWVVWRDDRNGSDVSGDMDIFWTWAYTDNISFASNGIVNDDPGSVSAKLNPKVEVVRRGNIYVVWTDSRNGDYDIFSTNAAVDLETTLLPNWNMFSFPLSPFTPDPDRILGDNIDSLYLLHYDTGTGGYQTYPQDSVPMESGYGYWIHLAESTLVDARGVTIDEQRDFSIELLSGWIQIGDPFNFTVDWGDVKVAYQGDTVGIVAASDSGWVSRYLYWYNPDIGGYEFAGAPDGQLDAWIGYWVQALVDCDLLIPPSPMTMEHRMKRPKAERQALQGLTSDKNWAIQLSAVGGSRSDLHNFAGVSPDASDGYDPLDAPEPPAVPGYISLYFPHSDWGDHSSNYTQNIREPLRVPIPLGQEQKSEGIAIKPAQKIWKFEVATDLTHTEITLSWPDLSSVPPIYKLFLVDVDADVTIDMRETSSYSYNSGQDVARHFKLIVRSR
jgi:hypothetical protein